MRFFADLHVHSRYSRATSSDLRPETIAAWARAKGLAVVGSGDISHPAWLAELEEKLEPAEEGLFRRKGDETAGPPPGGIVRFALSGEISTIYKAGERVRKVHHLVLLPHFEAARRFQALLGRVGNITSDGRPILGLDSRDLLEILLETSPDSILVPAHIWTPWFSTLGDKSGFDSIEACYRDLTPFIHAVETGLSSDPPMNWRCSFLDRFTIISNSDAHSAEKLGREATVFDAELSYPGIKRALEHHGPVEAPAPRAPGEARTDRQGADRVVGTVEFFPEEGKYHLDGHRACGVILEPRESIARGDICPVCGRRLTVGVLHRVETLADREPSEAGGAAARNGRSAGGDGARAADALDERAVAPGERPPFSSAIPLAELLAEIEGTGPASKRVRAAYDRLIAKVGSELELLLSTPTERLRSLGETGVAEAIERMREGRVHVRPGFDGEYGIVRVFTPPPPVRPKKQATSGGAEPAAAVPSASDPAPERTDGLTAEQEEAAGYSGGPALVVAGPGTGKTATLAAKVRLLLQEGVDPRRIAVLTFSNRAAEELRSRILGASAAGTAAAIRPAVGSPHGLPFIGTFHAFGLGLLRETEDGCGRGREFRVLSAEERESLLQEIAGRSRASLERALIRVKQELEPDFAPDERIAGLCAAYEAGLTAGHRADFDDLVYLPLKLLENGTGPAAEWRARYDWILVDEYQDVNAAQYRLLTALAPVVAGDSIAGAASNAVGATLFAIGDPDQAIYGFRGASPVFIRRFGEDYPDARVFRLSRSFRSSDPILLAAQQMVRSSRPRAQGFLSGTGAGPITSISEQASDLAEAEFIARAIAAMTGGTSFFSIDSGAAQEGSFAAEERGFGEIAVLVRLGRQMEPLAEALERHGIPYGRGGDLSFVRKEPVRSLLERYRAAVGGGGTSAAGSRSAATAEGGAREVPPGGPEDARRLTPAQLVDRLSSELPAGRGHAAASQGLRLVERLRSFAARYDTHRDFLESLALRGPEDDARFELQQVSLLTLHASKGLEFDVVFIAGCEEGLLPHALTPGAPTNVEEERRLLYVGMTRARQRLILTYARRRALFGREVNPERSRFLDDIEEELRKNVAAAARLGDRPPGSQLELF